MAAPIRSSTTACNRAIKGKGSVDHQDELTAVIFTCENKVKREGSLATLALISVISVTPDTTMQLV